MTLKSTLKIRYFIRYVIIPNPNPNPNPNIPSLRYVNVPKKTVKKTLITYLNPMYLQHYSPVPFSLAGVKTLEPDCNPKVVSAISTFRYLVCRFPWLSVSSFGVLSTDAVKNNS